MKTKLRLSYPHLDPDDGEGKFYRIEAVVGSVEFEPGGFLSRETVLDLCPRSDLKITVVSPPALRQPRWPRHR
jgi:hypothetical protein